MKIKLKQLSNIMLLANFISTLFYALSYPYIYAEMMKVIPKGYISFEQILACGSTVVFCKIWNKNSDKLFRYFPAILIAEVIADTILFIDVIIRKDLSFYFLLNVIIFSIITRNLSCGRTKMEAKINPSEKLREQYDNNDQIVYSLATLIGSVIAIFLPLNLSVLFIFAMIGNVIDNFFYLFIFYQLNDKNKE